MRRFARITAAALLAGAATAGLAAAQAGPPPDALTAPMALGRGGIDFVAIDANGDGSLSRDELVARATERLGRSDANGDGTLTREEIVAAMPGPRHGLMNLFAPDPSEAFADRLLAMMGATEAGQVAVEDLAQQRVNFLLAFVDTDRDAAVSRTEADAIRGQGRGPGWRHGHHRGMERADREGRGARQGSGPGMMDGRAGRGPGMMDGSGGYGPGMMDDGAGQGPGMMDGSVGYGPGMMDDWPGYQGGLGDE